MSGLCVAQTLLACGTSIVRHFQFSLVDAIPHYDAALTSHTCMFHLFGLLWQCCGRADGPTLVYLRDGNMINQTPRSLPIFGNSEHQTPRDRHRFGTSCRLHHQPAPETNSNAHSGALCVLGTDCKPIHRYMINVRPLRKVCPVFDFYNNCCQWQPLFV